MSLNLFDKKSFSCVKVRHIYGNHAQNTSTQGVKTALSQFCPLIDSIIAVLLNSILFDYEHKGHKECTKESQSFLWCTLCLVML